MPTAPFPPHPSDPADTLQLASDFLTASVSPRKSARLSSALINYKRPDALNLVPVGSNPLLDIFTRLHNGLRRELIDLYNMVDAMQRRIQHLRSSDLKMFFAWWDLFSSYVETCFEAHDRVLIPWVRRKGGMPESLSDVAVKAMNTTVDMMLREFDTTYSQLPRRPPDETMAKIIKGLVHMHPLVEYLETFENDVPLAIEQRCKHKDAVVMERKLARFLQRTGDLNYRQMHLSIVARGMTDEAASAWRRRLPFWIKISYRSTGKLFSSTHLAVVRKLAAD